MNNRNSDSLIIPCKDREWWWTTLAGPCIGPAMKARTYMRQRRVVAASMVAAMASLILAVVALQWIRKRIIEGSWTMPPVDTETTMILFVSVPVIAMAIWIIAMIVTGQFGDIEDIILTPITAGEYAEWREHLRALPCLPDDVRDAMLSGAGLPTPLDVAETIDTTADMLSRFRLTVRA